MAINGSASFVPTTRLFLANWQDANAALPPTDPLLLPAGLAGFPAKVTRADLLGLLETAGTGLIPLRTKVEEADNLVDTTSEALKLAKAPLAARLVEFNAYVRTWHENTKWVASLPEVPNPGNDEGNFTKPLDDVETLWNTMQTELETDIVLRDGYGYVDFADGLTELRSFYAAWSNATQQEGMAIQSRKAMEARIYAVLKKYREVVALRFAKDSPVYLTLPRLSPLPGHTPAAVILTGIWNAAETQAELGWTASTEATLKHYQIRFCSGADYENDEEEIVATILPGAPLVFLTPAGLSVAGATASYKVYVVLETDNEKGSDAVAVTRPV
ncbi:MAG: hypothetical protein V4689_04625 [Verrucomicrobiota bacterium]